MGGNKNKRICIIGAGIIGLSTAIKILQDDCLKDYHVEILSDAFTPYTTSDGAAGLWEPILLSDTSEELVERWAIETYHYILEHAGSAGGFSKGCFHCPVYNVFKDYEASLKEECWMKQVLGFRHLENGETQKLFPNFQHGWTFTTAIIEGQKFLPYLQEELVSSGRVKLIQERVENLAALTQRGFDLVVNCTGLGSLSLAEDELVRPIRGQVMRVHAPWIKYCVFADDPFGYVLVNNETVVLGGTKYENDWNLDVSEEDKDTIWRNCQEIVPSLAEATWIKDWVGLRPGRRQVRIEKEVKSFGDTSMKIVHNYGHGGGGLSLFWGCAKDCVQLIREFLLTT